MGTKHKTHKNKGRKYLPTSDGKHTIPRHELKRQYHTSKWGVEIYEKCFHLYCKQSLSPKKIGELTGVPGDTVKNWIFRHGWVDRRRKLYGDIRGQYDHEYAEIVKKERAKVARRHINAAAGIERWVGKREFTDKTDVKDVATAARALKSAADVSARAVQLTDRDTKNAPKIHGDIVNFNLNPSPVEEPIPRTIDVQILDEVEPDF